MQVVSNRTSKAILIQAEDIARRARFIWNAKRESWMAECTFAPILTRRGRMARVRTPQELSEGDRLQKELNVVSHLSLVQEASCI